MKPPKDTLGLKIRSLLFSAQVFQLVISSWKMLDVFWVLSLSYMNIIFKKLS